MADKSKIEWTDATWNPIRGCSRVSPGCFNCYAERTANRFNAPGKPYEGLVKITNGHPQWTGEVRFIEDVLLYPLRLRKPHLIFVNSMSDLFHDAVSDYDIDRIFGIMHLARQHTFQILTKRPERMLRYFNSSNIVTEPESLTSDIAERRDDVAAALFETFDGEWFSDKELLINQWPLPNVWLGVSVENQQYADERIPILIQTPAAVRWLSIEPLLGPVLLRQSWLCKFRGDDGAVMDWAHDCGSECNPIGWVVVGGESGPGARPMHPEWARVIRDQCKDSGVPFFFKQWGEWLPAGQSPEDFDLATLPKADDRYHQWSADESSVDIGKKKAGRLLDGVEHNGYPR